MLHSRQHKLQNPKSGSLEGQSRQDFLSVQNSMLI